MPPAASLPSLASRSDNSLNPPVQVVCAWPLSGQYGPGSRILFYVLVAGCVLARKSEFIRNACLAAALLFPAIAAVHAILLAALHIDGAVDMDVYGAFQMCSLGMLSVPITLKLSQTYFNNPARNAIFLWTVLIFAGLLSLTIEFYRLDSTPCQHDDTGNATYTAKTFPYGNVNVTCGLPCTVDQGPQSPMRQGSANNIYVIPAPTVITFNNGMLLSAACCIPAILYMIPMFFKIVEKNWEDLHKKSGKSQDESPNAESEKQARGINELVTSLLSLVEIPVFGVAVLALLIFGERDFFSAQVKYQTEPIATVGQWSPIAGTVFAALGSLYHLLSSKKEENVSQESKILVYHHNCGPDCQGGDVHSDSDVLPDGDEPLDGDGPSGRRGARVIHYDTFDTIPPGLSRNSVGDMSMFPTLTTVGHPQTGSSQGADLGPEGKGRLRVKNFLIGLTERLGTAVHTDDTDFQRGKARDWVEVPGERQRDERFHDILNAYNPPRGADGMATPVPPAGQRSRAGSDASGSGLRHASTSPARPSLPSSPPAALVQRPHANTSPPNATSFGANDPPSAEPSRGRHQSLTVPSRVHHE